MKRFEYFMFLLIVTLILASFQLSYTATMSIIGGEGLTGKNLFLIGVIFLIFYIVYKFGVRTEAK